MLRRPAFFVMAGLAAAILLLVPGKARSQDIAAGRT
jgi:hypothetical protein